MTARPSHLTDEQWHQRFTPYSHDLIATAETEARARACADFTGSRTGERTGAVPYFEKSGQRWIWAAVAFV